MGLVDTGPVCNKQAHSAHGWMPDAGDGVGVKKDAARPRACPVLDTGVIRRGIDRRGAATRGAAGLRLHRRPAHGRKTQLAQSLPRTGYGGKYVTGGKLRDVKRPACFHRQTGACRSCGLAVSQPCRRREEPVETTDAFRPTGGGRSTESAPSLSPTEGTINSSRQTGVQRRKRSTSNHRTGVQREKGLSLQPPDWTEDEGLSPLRWFGPRCLRRTNVNSASAAFPRGRPGESESSSGHARATGITHPGFLWSETLEKA